MRDLCTVLEEKNCDVKGALARFLDDKVLYEEFVVTAMEDECFKKLEYCMKENKFEEAFEYAHTMKGVSGNLGITPLYEVICTLVEELRAKRYEGIEFYYEAVRNSQKEFYDTVKGSKE